MEAEQVRKDFSRGLHEERVFVVSVGEKRCGQSQSIGSLPQFIPWSPVGHPLVQRIENQIAARWSKKVGHVVGGRRRIVHDGRLTALLDLQQDLPDQRTLSFARIAHNQNVARFGLARQAQPSFFVEYLLREVLLLQEADTV